MKFNRAQTVSVYAIITLTLVFFWWWVSTAYNRPFEFNFSKTIGQLEGGYRGEYGIDYYNALTSALLKGQLHLDVKHRLYDSAFYHGKCYLYFSPVPVFFLFAPFRMLLPGHCLPQDLGVLILYSIEYLLAFGILRYLKAKLFKGLPFGIFILSIAVLSLINIPMIDRPDVYELAVCAGGAFMMAGILLTLRAALELRAVVLRLFLGGACIGLAVAARPNLLPVSIFTPLLILSLFGFGRKALRKIVWFVSSWLVIAPLIGCYNYLRFGSPLDFGAAYLNAAHRFFEPQFIPTNLFLYLFQPPAVSSHFPYLFLNSTLPDRFPRHYIGVEPVVGLAFVCPIVVFALICLAVHHSPDRFFKKISSYLILTALAVMTINSCAVGYMTVRYLSDSVMLILLSSIVAFWWLYLGESKPWRRRLLAVCFVVLSFWGIILNGWITPPGYDRGIPRGIYRQYPPTYRFARQGCQWIIAQGSGLAAVIRERVGSSAVSKN